MTMAAFVAFLKSVPALLKLVQGFVDTWQAGQVIIITHNQEQRAEEREAIIWSMEQARLAHDSVKMRALNRSLAALDGGGVLPARPIQPTEN